MSTPAQEKMIFAVDFIISRGDTGVGAKELSEFLDCHQRTARRIMSLIRNMKFEFRSLVVMTDERTIKIFVK